MDALSDNALMLQVKAGEIDKLGLLFERHHRQLFGYFYHMTGEAELSEDMVQNVFYRILKYRHTYRGEGKFVYWMYSLARNVGSDHFRKPNPLAKTRDLDTVEHVMVEEKHAQSQLERSESINLLRRAMAQLSPEKREALILSRFQGMKYKEIADLSNSTVSSIKTRIHRAMKELKVIYTQLENQ